MWKIKTNAHTVSASGRGGPVCLVWLVCVSPQTFGKKGLRVGARRCRRTKVDLVGRKTTSSCISDYRRSPVTAAPRQRSFICSCNGAAGLRGQRPAFPYSCIVHGSVSRTRSIHYVQCIFRTAPPALYSPRAWFATATRLPLDCHSTATRLPHDCLY